MTIRESVTLPKCLLLVLLCFLTLVPPVAGALSYQSNPSGVDAHDSDGKTTSKAQGGALAVTTYLDIPEATEPCAPEACQWWNEIRTTGNILNKKDDKKLKARFLLLLHEGQQKSYRVPVEDRPAQVLAATGRPTYPQGVRGKVRGSAAISIEYRADGSIGEVKIVRSLGLGIDESLITAARKSLFLPAVQNGAFVTSRFTATAEFHVSTPFPSRL